MIILGSLIVCFSIQKLAVQMYIGSKNTIAINFKYCFLEKKTCFRPFYLKKLYDFYLLVLLLTKIGFTPT